MHIIPLTLLVCINVFNEYSNNFQALDMKRGPPIKPFLTHEIALELDYLHAMAVANLFFKAQCVYRGWDSA